MAGGAKTRSGRKESLQLFSAWLEGAGLTGFRFDTGFSLYFSRGAKTYNGFPLPNLIELQLLGEWWFGAQNDWLAQVELLGEGVEPDEPLKAFRLTALRWSDGAVVQTTTFDEKEHTIGIVFENGVCLTVSLVTDDEYALLLKESDVREQDATWSVAVEDDGMHYRMPSWPA